MIRRWIGTILTLFALLWAKLPGQSDPDDNPARGFRIKRKGPTGDAFLFSSEASEPLLSEQTAGIAAQRVKPEPNGWSFAEDTPRNSRVQVRMTSPSEAEVHVSSPEMRDVLASGVGQYAIVTGIERDGELVRQDEVIAESRGSGEWRILKRLVKK